MPVDIGYLFAFTAAPVSTAIILPPILAMMQ
jgi:hypothetical protein